MPGQERRILHLPRRTRLSTHGRQPLPGLADAHTLEFIRLVGGVLDPIHTLLAQIVPQRPRLHAQQRTQQQHLIARAPGGHPLCPARAAPGAHRHRLRLIRRMVAEQQMQIPRSERGLGQSHVPSGASGFLQPGIARQTGKGKNMRGNASRFQPPGGNHRLCRRIGAQAVVDNQRQHMPTTGGAKFMRQQRQCGAVRPTGDGHGKAWFSPKRPELRQRLGKYVPYWQCALLLTASMRGCIPAGGVGNWLLREAMVSQAASVWPMALKLLARPSSD